MVPPGIGRGADQRSLLLRRVALSTEMRQQPRPLPQSADGGSQPARKRILQGHWKLRKREQMRMPTRRRKAQSRTAGVGPPEQSSRSGGRLRSSQTVSKRSRGSATMPTTAQTQTVRRVASRLTEQSTSPPKRPRALRTPRNEGHQLSCLCTAMRRRASRCEPHVCRRRGPTLLCHTWR